MSSLADHVTQGILPNRADLSVSDKMLEFFSRTFMGEGAPEGSVVGYIGSEYTDIVTGNRYYKKSADGLNTGWVIVDSAGAVASVTSVNGHTGVVTLGASDVSADAAGLAASTVAAHEADTTAVHGIANTANLETVTGSQAKVDAAIAALINSAPGVLDTLEEIADALGDDPNFAATMTTALAGKQTSDATLTALAALVIAANSLTIGTGADAFTQTTFGVNTFPARASTGNLVAKTISDFILTLMDDTDAATARATLGLTLGTNVQAFDQTLAALAAADWVANDIPIGTGTDTLSQLAITANKFPARASTGNIAAKDISDFALTFLDDADAATVLATLGAANDLLVPNNQTGTTYTLVLTDRSKVIECNNASAITLTIPLEATVNFAIGTVIEVYQQGAGQVTVAHAGTLRAPGGTKTRVQYSTVALWKRASDLWVISGDATT